MSFFYDLNKKLDSIRATPEVTHQQLNERDMGKHNNATTGFKALAKKAGGGEKGERIAGAQFQKMKKVDEASNAFTQSAPYPSFKKKKPVSKEVDNPSQVKPKSKDLDPVRKKYDKYDNEKVDEDFGPGRTGPNKNLPGPTDAGPTLSSPDSANYKTPNIDNWQEKRKSIDKEMGDYYSVNRWPGALSGALDKDAAGQLKYVDRTAPGVINKIKDKLGLDMPDPAYGPKPDERERLAKRYPKPANENLIPVPAKPKSTVDKAKTPPPYRPSKSAPKGDSLGTIKGGVWTADPPKRGEKGVPLPMDPEGVKEAAGSIDYEKVLEAIAALYGDDMWDNDAMGDLAQDLEQAGPTDRELDFIIAKGKLPTRLKNIRFTNTDDVQFGHLDEKNGAPMTATGKKLNFADKIANAKKEVDEMLGDVAAEAMRSALSPKQKKMAALGGDPKRIDGPDLAALRKGADMGEERSKGTAFDMSTPRAATPKVGSIERGHKHDIKHTATGRMVTRRTDDQGISVGGETDDEGNKKEKRTKAGRPDGTGKKIGAKGPSGKSKLMTKEGEVDIQDQGEYDQEGDMAKDDIKTIVRHAQALSKVLGDNDNLPEWVQSKLAKIEGMMISIDEYMQNQAGEDDEEPIAEEPRSKNQAVAARIARGVQKGTANAKPGSASAEMAKMQPKELNKFAKGSTKGLPKKVPKNKEEVDENSEDGRLTTTRTGPGQTSTSSSTGRISATVDKGQVTVKPAKSGGTSYGKGIYDSMNYELELMIAESMSVNMSDSTEGNKSLTVTATDEDAMKLAMILKSAGLGGGDAHGGDMHSHGEEACDTCGMQDCGCGDVQEAVDENAPDWPTNTEQADNNFGYAGGLNKPKADVAGNGQSTVPVVATRPHNDDLRRMKEMAGIQNEDNIDLGPTSPEIARMSKDEVNAALRSGMSSPDISAMSSDEVNAALRSGMSPNISDMNPDSDNAEFGKDSIQRMREMAGIKEAKTDLANHDYDGDGKRETGAKEHAGSVDKAIKKAQAEKKVDESIFALTNQWKAYKG